MLIVLLCLAVLAGMGFILYQVSPDGFGLFEEPEGLGQARTMQVSPALAKMVNNATTASAAEVPGNRAGAGSERLVKAAAVPLPKGVTMKPLAAGRPAVEKRGESEVAAEVRKASPVVLRKVAQGGGKAPAAVAKTTRTTKGTVPPTTSRLPATNGPVTGAKPVVSSPVARASGPGAKAGTVSIAARRRPVVKPVMTPAVKPVVKSGTKPIAKRVGKPAVAAAAKTPVKVATGDVVKGVGSAKPVLVSSKGKVSGLHSPMWEG